MFNFNVILEWWYFLYLAIFIMLVYGSFYFLSVIRKKTINELNHLLLNERNYFLYQELLNNKKLRIVFSKAQIAVLQLQGYMMEGDDEKIISLISDIDEMKLKGYAKLNYLLKRFTYFIDILNQDESKHSLDMLESLVLNAKSNDDAIKLLNEARFTYAIYIDKDITLIPKLKSMIDKDNHPQVKGILMYRLAKLYYFNKQNTVAISTLKQAKKLMIGTYYEDIINQGLSDLKILEEK